MLKIALSIFIIAHGLVHTGLAAAPNPDDPEAKAFTIFTAVERSWLLPKLGMDAAAVQWTGIILVGLSTLGFILTGLGMFGVPGLSVIWRGVAVFSACTSLLLLVLFWHRWFPVGVLIDAGVLVSLLLLKWPTADIIG